MIEIGSITKLKDKEKSLPDYKNWRQYKICITKRSTHIRKLQEHNNPIRIGEIILSQNNDTRIGF